MRIAILTQPLRQNYGGILQNYALQTVLRRMGHQVVTLDPPRYHYRWREHPMYSFRVLWNDFLLRQLKGAPLNKNHFLLYYLTHTFKHLFFKNQDDVIFSKKKDDECRRIIGKNLYRFIDKRIERQEYHDLVKEIKASDFDVFIVGSDQVWRREYNRERIQDMFLVFTKDWGVRRIAYAASFGTDEWEYEHETTVICREAIRAFDIVTVRECSGVDICRSVFDVSADQVLDSTMLLLKEDYFNLLSLDKVAHSQGNLLVYILDETEDKTELINRIAKDYHLVPFRVNADVDNQCFPLNKRIQPTVEKWLRGFYDAEYVITDSFHGCVFSIVFRKPFVIYANKTRGLARFESLLDQLHLKNCMVSSADGFNGFFDYLQDINRVLDAQRDKSLTLLKDALRS